MGSSNVVWDGRKVPIRSIAIVFVICLVSLLALIWITPLLHLSGWDANFWFGILFVGILTGVVGTGVIILSYVTGLPIDEG
jgi:hypothetical protein